MCGSSPLPAQAPEVVGFKGQRRLGRPSGLQMAYSGRGPMVGPICSVITPPRSGTTIVPRATHSGRQLEVEGKEGVAEGEEGEGQGEEAGIGDVVRGVADTYLPPENDAPV